MSNNHAGHRGRLKKKFIDGGLENFYEHQILELILFYSIPQGDTNPTAHRLISRFGSLMGVLNADHEELMTVKGVGNATATWLKALQYITSTDLFDPCDVVCATSVGGMLEFFKYEFAECNEQTARLICADDCMNMVEVIEFVGYTLDRKLDRRILEEVLRANCSQVIMAIYRPTKPAFPTDEDKACGRALRDIFAAFNIDFSELAIIDREYVSYIFRQMRLPILWHIKNGELLRDGIKRRKVSFDKPKSAAKKHNCT
ncbi:MAG: hypothetical protein IJX54_05585 [Oscillospiraceae bacterium]|nr:hypothetical protein [Oscillospiraceae bacterium]